MSTSFPDAVTAPAVRLLPPEEFPRLSAYEPFGSGGLPDPTHWRVIVAEADGVIVAFLCLFEAVHLEPFWIAPSHRHHPHLFLDLWRQTKAVLDEAGVSAVFATIDDASLLSAGAFLEHLGFTQSPGALYLLYVPHCRLEA